MTKQPTESQTDSFFNPTICPHCHTPIDRTYSKEVNYCGHCGGAISKEAFGDLMMKVYYAARDYPGIILIINDDFRNAYNKFSEKTGQKKLQDPRDIIPILAKQYNLTISSQKQEQTETSTPSFDTGSSYLAQILKELHEINMKLGGAVPTTKIEKSEQEIPAPKKRGRPKKNPN